MERILLKPREAYVTQFAIPPDGHATAWFDASRRMLGLEAPDGATLPDGVELIDAWWSAAGPVATFRFPGGALALEPGAFRIGAAP